MARQQIKFSELVHFTARQLQAVALLLSGTIKFLLYGGALGGGKSYFLRWFCVLYLIHLASNRGIRRAVAMLACEDYPSLKDRQLVKIAFEFPEWLGKFHDDHKAYGRCFILAEEYGGGVICFRNLDDPSKYASAEFCLIAVDELTKNLYDVFVHLKSRLRWPGLEDVECLFVAGTNPGSVGHGWVKQIWMDHLFSDEWIHPIDYRDQFAYVPSKADDNPHLPESYWNSLNTLPVNLRKAFRDGDWNIFLGQAFPEFGPMHKLPNDTPVPEHAMIYQTFDWGYGKPFSCGWHWIDSDGRIYRFAEWYGCSGNPDEGLRLTDSEIAEGIIEREKRLNIDPAKRTIIRIGGPDNFAKKPNYAGKGQIQPTALTFRQVGEKMKHALILHPGDADRVLKVRQMHERLRYTDENKKTVVPMFQVYERCVDFIRTVPTLVQDKLNIEDIDTDGEDHCFDDVCFLFLARPLGQKKADEKPKKPPQNISEVAARELEQIRREYEVGREIEMDF